MTKIENIYDHPNYFSLDDFPGEVWKQIPGFSPQYFVSNIGRVKSVGSEFTARWGNLQKSNGGILRISSFRGGYKRVNLDRKGYGVHRVMALAFLEPIPTPKHQVNHKNGIKKDNRIENLEWMTPGENTQHAVDIGLLKSIKGLDNKRSFQIAQCDLNGEVLAVYASGGEAERATDVRSTNIYLAIKGVYKQVRGFIWKKITKEEYFMLKEKLEREAQPIQAGSV